MMLANPTPQLFAQRQQRQQQTNDTDGIDRHQHRIFNTAAPAVTNPQPQQRLSRLQRKRKADDQPENNERLSKRMSLLNLEQGGTKLYVPVENPQLQQALLTDSKPSSFGKPVAAAPSPPTPPRAPQQRQNGTTADDDIMHLDDSKHKVYIYNMEDELSSGDDSESEESGKLVFLPDIEKHLLNKRILPSYMDINNLPMGHPSAGPNPVDLEKMQLVLYNVPSSISVPEEQDSVRKAIIEARARTRENQAKKQQQQQTQTQTQTQQHQLPLYQPLQTPTPAELLTRRPSNAFQGYAPAPVGDPDAMELD